MYNSSTYVLPFTKHNVMFQLYVISVKHLTANMAIFNGRNVLQ